MPSSANSSSKCLQSPEVFSAGARHVLLSYDQLVPGDVMRIWVQFQVNPTAHGTRDFSLELDDGKTPLTTVHRNLSVLR